MTVGTLLYGGSTVALTGNADLTLLTLAERIATVNTSNQTAYYARGVYVYLNVTAITATPSIVLKIQAEMPNGDYITLLEATAVTATGETTYLLHPDAGAAAGDVTKVVNYPLPLTWRVRVEHGDADAITYEIYAAVVV